MCSLRSFSEPLAESANGRRGVGIKVDVGEPNSSSLCRITQLRISLWPELFRPAALPGLRLRGLEFDSYGGGGRAGGGGGCCNSQGLPFSGSGANCLNPLIKSSILLACNSQWKHLGRGKDPICPAPHPPPSALGELTHHLNLQTHTLQRESHPGCVIFMLILIWT